MIAPEAAPTAPASSLAGSAQHTGVAAFPLIGENPYQSVLYRELAAHGFSLVHDADFKLAWLWRARRRVDVLHFHWPQNYYLWWRRPASLRMPLSWLKIAMFASRLVFARALGFTVVWTVHEVYPHERAGRRLDWAGSTILARAAHVLIAHDRGTAERASRQLGVAADAVDVVPHGSYIGVYPTGRHPAEVRDSLGIAPDSFVFLCFGHIRAYKAVELLLRSLELPTLPPGVSFVIAGVPLSDETAAAVRRAAARDPRIKPMLEFVPDERVAELFDASDVAVLPRSDGGTSGSLVLALSMGKPVVAADTPDYADLVGDAGWLFQAGNVASFAAALTEAAAEPDEATRRGALARVRAERLSWPRIAERTASIILAARPSRRARRLT